VKGAAEKMTTTSATLLDYIAKGSPCPDELDPIRVYAIETSRALNAVLSDASSGALLAKRRLRLEATLAQMAPELTSLVEHLELLLFAAKGVAVSLPLAELLSSRPSHGSSRPLHDLLVVGPAEDAHIKLPPRVGLGALSLLSQATALQGAPALLVSTLESGRVELRYCRRDEVDASRGPQLNCQVPIALRITPSFSVARHVLCSFGAAFSKNEPAEFSLPAAETD
jgi:hypothetical protein